MNANLGQACLPKIGNSIIPDNLVQFTLIMQAIDSHNSHDFYQDVDKTQIPKQAAQTSFPLGEMFVNREGTLDLFDRIIILENFPSIPFK